MNAETAIAIGKIFLVEVFQRMNEAPGWAFELKEYINDDYTFQEICENVFDGDLDECLNIFFRKIMTNFTWFSQWQVEKEYFQEYSSPIKDLSFVSYTFNNYMKETSVEDLKEVLGLDIMLK